MGKVKHNVIYIYSTSWRHTTQNTEKAKVKGFISHLSDVFVKEDTAENIQLVPAEWKCSWAKTILVAWISFETVYLYTFPLSGIQGTFLIQKK